MLTFNRTEEKAVAKAIAALCRYDDTDGSHTVAILGSQKTGNQEKGSCFFALVFIKCFQARRKSDSFLQYRINSHQAFCPTQ